MNPTTRTSTQRRPAVPGQRDGTGRLRFVVLVVGLCLALSAAAFWGTTKPLLEGFGDLGPLTALPAISGVAVAIVAMVPRTLVAVTAGALFGWVPAIAYVLVGALLGASIAFATGRWLGRDFVAAKLRSWADPTRRGTSRRAAAWLKRQVVAVDAWLERDGIMGIWIIRMVPVTHYGVTSYIAGAAAVRYGHFLVGTLLATIPGAVGFTAVGGAVVDRADLPWAGGVATAAGIVGLAAAWLVRRRFASVGGEVESPRKG